MNDPEIQAAQVAAVKVIRKQAGDLGTALATWHARDDSGPCPEARRAANAAMDAVDAALAEAAINPGRRPRVRARRSRGARGDSGSLTSSTTTVLPTCCAVCLPSAAESGQIAALKHLYAGL